MAAMDLTLSGLSSGFDWKTMVDKITQVNQMPQAAVRKEQAGLTTQNNVLTQLNTRLTDLKAKVDALQSETLYTARKATSSNTSVATVKAAGGAVLGDFSLTISQLATPATWVGAGDQAGSLAATFVDRASVDAGPTLAAAPFATTVTGGTFTINGHRITVSTTDTLQAVFQNIHDNAGGIEGSYDPVTDRISLTSPDGSDIVVGATGDTSNFLQVARLYGNPVPGGTLQSETSLGSLRPFKALDAQPFKTALGVPAGGGSFEVNGTTVTYKATDSLSAVLNRINQSAAGVVATFDFANDRVLLRNTQPGDRTVSLADVSGNFLAAVGLTAGSLSRGKDLKYSLDGGVTTLTSNSNTLTDVSSGLTGITVDAVATGTLSISVSQDTSVVRTAITSLVSSANSLQSLIDSATASTTDAAGKVTPGLMEFDPLMGRLGSSLRQQLLRSQPDNGLAIHGLDDLGYGATGYSDQLVTKDSTKLDEALADNLAAVQSYFTTATSGFSARLGAFLSPYLEGASGGAGLVATKQAANTKRSSELDRQLANMEKVVQDTRTRMLAEFQAYEAASARNNQQLQLLNSKILA